MKIGRLLALLALLGGCATPQFTRTPRVPADADAFARQYVRLLIAGDTARAVALLDPVWTGPGTAQQLADIGAAVHGRLESLLRVASEHSLKAGRWYYMLGYEAHVGSDWLLVEIALSQPDSSTAPARARSYAVAGVRGQWLEQSLEQTNALTLRHKTPDHYLILLFGLASLGFILYTLVVILRTRGVRRWAWALVSLIGVGSLQLNWTTGQPRFIGLAIVLFGFGLGRTGPAGPWIVQASFPLGAALFYTRHLLRPFWRAPEDPGAAPRDGPGDSAPTVPAQDAAGSAGHSPAGPGSP